MHGHIFEWIWVKFGMWHPYTLRMVMGWLASATGACRLVLRALSIYAAANGWQAPSNHSELAASNHNGLRCNRAP